MCYSPTLIKNPNWHQSEKVAPMADRVSQWIPVPCGHCAECVRLRANGVLQRAQLEEVAGWPFFVTLTYNNASLPVHTCSNGRKVRFADVSDVQNMFKRLRNNNSFGRKFRFFAVSELGSLKGRPHFHILLFFQRMPDDNVYTPITLETKYFPILLSEWRRNYALRLNKKGELVSDNVHPDYRPLCTYVSRYIGGKLNSTYDFHYVRPSTFTGNTDDVSFYVTKYLFKDSDQKDKLKLSLKRTLDPDEFQKVWQKIKPRSFSSLNFGFGIYDNLNPRYVSRSTRLDILQSLPSADYLRSCIARSKETQLRPRYFDKVSGKSLPLSRYWYRFGRIYTPVDAVHFWMNDPNGRADNVTLDERDMTSKLLSESHYLSQLKNDKPTLFDTLYGES